MNMAVSIKNQIRDFAPLFLRRSIRRLKADIRDRRNRRLTAKEVFTRIYREKMWGNGAGTFYSGPGSDAEAAQPYADFVTSFIAKHNIRSVVDLGCGDFRVGRMIASCGVDYTGVDVVEALIEENNRCHANETINFQCLDIAHDPLPNAELCLIREVFQHISNAQISATLSKLRQYDYVLFTDIQPEVTSDYKINKDKPHGASSRILQTSFLRLEAPPFNVGNIALVFETAPPYFKSYAPYGSSFKLRTFLIRPAANP
ncbi:class I SAM-dependent methyltransferase [Rhodopila sp.]|uniref:class I SAM-dependent methyltransferase n=1 Tax=Rhodopila sp. TaxID=2480087 RepID=UPI003D135A80